MERFRNSDAILKHLTHVGPKLPELLAVAPITRFEVFGDLNPEAEKALEALDAKNYAYREGFVR